MVAVVISLHVLVCILMTVVVLLQQGKGADIGAVFGGSSQTLFGASGAGNFLTKTTGVLALIFFMTSLYLAHSSAARVSYSVFDRPVKVPAASAKTAPAAAKPGKAPSPVTGNKK